MDIKTTTKIPIVVSVTSSKGGVGKSTIATNIAYYYQYIENKKVLLVDTDKQMSSFFWTKLREQLKLPKIEAINIVTADIHKKVEEYKKQYDVIIIDSCGRDSAELRSGIIASNLVIIPTYITTFDIWALQQTLEIATDAQKANHNMKIEVVFNKALWRMKKKEIDIIMQCIKKYISVKADEIPIIYQRRAFQIAATEGKSIFEYSNFRQNKLGKQDFERLLNNIRERVYGER